LFSAVLICCTTTTPFYWFIATTTTPAAIVFVLCPSNVPTTPAAVLSFCAMATTTSTGQVTRLHAFHYADVLPARAAPL
jgi:hypothetical protein